MRLRGRSSTLVASAVVTWERREYAAADLDGAWLVHTATGDRAVDDAGGGATPRQRRIWCVRADDARGSRAWTPAVARAGDVTVAVTAGGDPRRATALRDAIALALDSGGLPLRPHRPARPGTSPSSAAARATPG